MTDLPLRDAPTDPGSAAPPPPPPRRRFPFVLAGIAIIVGALGVWVAMTLLPRWLTGQQGAAPVAAGPSGSPGEGRRIQATLFYVSDDGTTLVGVSHEVLYGATPAEQARAIVEAQVGPPPNERLSAIPRGTTVRSVFLTDAHEAYVDLGGTVVSGQTGGSLDEALGVYAIVNAVIANLPDITAVQILVDGKEVDSLAGHIDLRAPLGRNAEWEQKGP